MRMPAMLPGRGSALPHLSIHAAIASGSRCYLPISSASCDLADLDCGARAAHKMSSHSGLLRRTFAGLPSSLLDRRRQPSCAQRDQCRTSAPPLIKMPPASNGNPPYKGRSEELTTNIADFCNKIWHKADVRCVRYSSVIVVEMVITFISADSS